DLPAPEHRVRLSHRDLGGTSRARRAGAVAGPALRRGGLAGARAVRPRGGGLRRPPGSAAADDARELRPLPPPPRPARPPAPPRPAGQPAVRALAMTALRTVQITRRVDPHLSIDRYDPEGELMLLHFGPQHPSTHGVFRMDLYLDGEKVVKVVPHVGYLHRAVEKLCEKLAYVQITPIVDKNDYVSPMTNEQALNMAFEALLKLEVPRRARWMRSLFAELQRIASHLLWLGTFALDLGGALGGGATVFLHCFRERELVLDLFEEVTGARFHYNTHTIGGNRHDIPAGWSAKVKAAMATIGGRLDEYESMTLQ